MGARKIASRGHIWHWALRLGPLVQHLIPSILQMPSPIRSVRTQVPEIGGENGLRREAHVIRSCRCEEGSCSKIRFKLWFVGFWQIIGWNIASHPHILRSQLSNEGVLRTFSFYAVTTYRMSRGEQASTWCTVETPYCGFNFCGFSYPRFTMAQKNIKWKIPEIDHSYVSNCASFWVTCETFPPPTHSQVLSLCTCTGSLFASS